MPFELFWEFHKIGFIDSENCIQIRWNNLIHYGRIQLIGVSKPTRWKIPTTLSHWTDTIKNSFSLWFIFNRRNGLNIFSIRFRTRWSCIGIVNVHCKLFVLNVNCFWFVFLPVIMLFDKKRKSILFKFIGLLFPSFLIQSLSYIFNH